MIGFLSIATEPVSGLSLAQFKREMIQMTSRNLIRILALTSLISGVSAMPIFAHASTGAGADTGTGESSVRIPRSDETHGPADSASTVKAPLAGVQPKKNMFDELSVTIGNETYVTRASGTHSTTSFNEISARVRKKSQGPLLSAAIDAGASIAANANNYSNIEVPEAYFQLNVPKTAHQLKREEAGLPVTNHIAVTAGRKKERWSGLDSDWSLGVVQPFNKFDALRPTEQGLVGAFADVGTGAANVLLFASPFFVPEQTAPFEVKNGKFTTSSPWFAPPPDSLILIGQQRSALYTIAMPEISEVVKNPSYGARLRVADPSGEGFYIQGSFLRKPQNSIAISYTGQLSISEGTTYGDVTIKPQVVYHSITAADIGYTTKNLALEFAALNERPDQPTLTPGLTTSHFNNATMLSPSVEFRTFTSKIWGPKLRISYLNTIGGEVIPVGEYAQNGNLLGQRTTFRRALSTSIESTLHRSTNWSFNASARWVEELEEQGSVLMTDFGVGIGDSWKVSVQADLIGSQKPTSYTETFISKFRANDRVAGRVTYLF